MEEEDNEVEEEEEIEDERHGFNVLVRSLNYRTELRTQVLKPLQSRRILGQRDCLRSLSFAHEFLPFPSLQLLTYFELENKAEKKTY